MTMQNRWLFEAPFPSPVRGYSPYSNLKYEHEWLFEGSPTAPTLISSESSPPDLTLYARIDLGCTKKNGTTVCVQPMTGIFIPQGYKPSSQIDLIIYLQGHHKSPVVKGKAPKPGYFPTNLTIDQYWNNAFYPFFPLREGVNASGKNVILAAPTLGPGSETGSLVQPGGFDAYVDQVIASLTANGFKKSFNPPLSVGKIILACHSGGGYPMRQIALSKEQYAAKILECWGFDCTYNKGDDTEWIRWASGNSSSNLYIYYIANSTTAPLSTKILSNAKKNNLANINVFIEPSTSKDHNEVPKTYWVKRIQGASFLSDR